MRRTSRTTAALSAAALTLCTVGGLTSATALTNLRDAPSVEDRSVVPRPVEESSTAQARRGTTSTAPLTKGTAISIPAVGLDAGLNPIRFQGSVFTPPSDINAEGSGEPSWRPGSPAQRCSSATCLIHMTVRVRSRASGTHAEE